MTAQLTDTLLDSTHKPAFVADAQSVLDGEVAAKKGASGLAVKGGYAAMKKVSPTIVGDALDSLLPQFLQQLQPFWQDYQAGGAGSFADALTARSDEAAEALLSVTDARAERSSRPSMTKIYSSMRGAAKKHVIEALPQVGALVQRHAG
ncbi:DUF6918 family protein [Skermania piniformis]|uniref:Uncharacterized protein n=1 Tax=Skermania pinensis TaxID=39122 RepID=A0ABX8SCY8_9ACTN|nr:hypothetical protein [Skermania piniformis]QXQ14465.1 hypothetical protein KV203_03340 [Skermania piniformis]